MRNFTSLEDVPDLPALIARAENYRSEPLRHRDLGAGKTIALLFFNASLRTRLSTQRAAANLGLNCVVMNFGSEGWQLEFQDGTTMNGGAAEHIREAAGVLSQYAEIIGLRSFAGLTDREQDYAETVLQSFIRHATVPVVSLESATRHPLQSFADLLTIRAHRKQARPVVALSWAPHPRALPQAVPNSFVEWMRGWGEVELRICRPPGMELPPELEQGVAVFENQSEGLAGAHFVYAKNWSGYHDYGKIATGHADWMIDERTMARTDQGKFMHCLPVRRNVVVADEILDGPRSLVMAQAGNRIYAAQAVLSEILNTLA